MKEEQKTEIMQALPQDAKDKLSEISARIKLTRESIDSISKPGRNNLGYWVYS